MKTQGIVLLVAGMLVVTNVAVAGHNRMSGENMAAHSVTDPANNRAEIARIQAHLEGVESELIAADVSHLTARQRANRMQHIAALRQYRERGVFPHNHVANEHTPVFIDEHGTHCAVGYLLAQSGQEKLAQRIAAGRNLARVPELSDLPELVAWLDDAGLTLDEAARIQPWYGPGPAPRTATDNSYAVVSAVATGFSGASIAWNLLADREGSAWWVPGAVGIGMGLADGALALSGISENSVRSTFDNSDEVSDVLIGVNVAVGLISAIAGVRTLGMGRADRAPTDAAVGNTGNARLELAPWTAPNGGSGLRIAIQF